MTYNCISLNTLILKAGLEYTKVILSGFSCPQNKEIEKFIKTKAIDFERINLTWTFLIFIRVDNSLKLVAFYSLGLGRVVIRKKLTRKQKKQYFGTTYPIGKDISTVLIGQISKNYSFDHQKYVKGSDIINIIIEKLVEINKSISAVSVQIECEDVNNLKLFYEQFGFKFLYKNDKNNLCTYLIPTSKLLEKGT